MSGKAHHVWLVGTGLMSIDYAKVLNALNISYTAIGRGETSARAFEEATGVAPCTGGLEKFLSGTTDIPDKAIVAVGIEALATTCYQLVQHGVKQILLEKPGIGYPSEIKALTTACSAAGAKVFLAYNRRFYSSVIKVQELIEEDGGPTSFAFEFTEWSHVIRGLKKEKAEHHNWFLGNSTHLIDTAFYLCGDPAEMSSYVRGALDWHPSSSIFSGAGISTRGAVFSYHANWESPGRWVLEIITRKRRFIFKPMESLQVQEIGSVAVNPVEIDNTLDTEYKPGLYKQTEAFINDDFSRFCTLEEQEQKITKYYLKMSGYTLDELS